MCREGQPQAKKGKMCVMQLVSGAKEEIKEWDIKKYVYMNKLRELTKGMNKWLGMQALHICDNS